VTFNSAIGQSRLARLDRSFSVGTGASEADVGIFKARIELRHHLAFFNGRTAVEIARAERAAVSDLEKSRY
jgi:hypothetical protein